MLTEYEKGRADAIRDIVNYLAQDLHIVPEPVRKMMVGLCREVEQFSMVAPLGRGRIW